MAQVRIEVDFDTRLEGGVEGSGTARIEMDCPLDPHEMLDSAQRAILLLIPPKWNPLAPRDGGRVDPPRDQCSECCPHDEAGHPPERCERRLGHDGRHWGDGFSKCEWADAVCNELLEFGSCPEPRGHEGPHVDSGRCTAVCPEPHERSAQCRLAGGHLGAHRTGRGPLDVSCAWPE